MRKNRRRMLARSLSVLCVWVLSGIQAFAAESSLMTATTTINQASVLTQTGSLNVIGYIAVGMAMAGFGFMVRKKI